MNISKKTIINSIALLITAITIFIPGYFFSEEVKAQVKKGWLFYNEKAKVLPMQIDKVKTGSISAMFNEGESNSDNTLSPIGHLKVITPEANIRSTPKVPVNSGENIVYKADFGQELPYYETTATDAGNKWYKLINSETGEECWISGNTVELVE
jgi:hypothetical protein